MEFKILGRTRLHINGNDIDLGSAKQRAVLALLLYCAGKAVPLDRFASAVWRNSSATEVRGRLQPLISRLRKVLSSSGTGGVIHHDGEAYRLELAPEVVDYHRFRILAETGRVAAAAGDHHHAKALLQDALRLWQGRPLHELDGPWVEHCRHQMETFDRIPAQYALLDSRLELGELVEVMGEAGRLTREHRLDERLARIYLRSLDGLGEYATALEFHEEFRTHLFAEIGSAPGPELRGVYHDILRKQADTGPATPPRRPPPRDLPRDLKTFTGRADLLADLDRVLASGTQGQVVALHGMPGIGKTRLAIHWAHRNAAHFPDGQLALDLRGFGPGTPLAPDDALGILLAKLNAGPVPVSREERRDRLRRLLDGKSVLLLLDNARDSAQVRPILDATDDCFVLITSRTRPFGLPVHDDAARVVHVPPLSGAESEELLRSMIGGDRADQEPTAVDELVGRLAGHPFALKIIAQHVAHRPETSIADLVEEFASPEGLGILGSSDDNDDENATLVAAFSWSYRALPLDTARTFRLLGLLFTTEFGPAEAAALTGEPISATMRTLRTLTKANLLQYSAGRRFRLHDLTHDYAADLVRHENSPQDRKAALTGLLNHYLAKATAACRRLNHDQSPVPPLAGVPEAEPFGSDQAALDWFTTERANLVAAVPRAVSAGFADHAWRLAGNVHDAFDRLGYYADLLVCQRAALKAARMARDDHAQAGLLADTGTVHLRLGQYDQAVEAYEQSIAIARDLGLHEMEVLVVHNLTKAQMERGEIARAVDLGRSALASAQALGNATLEAAILGQLGAAHRRIERDDLALGFLRDALALWERVGNARGQGTVLTTIGSLLHEHGEDDEALASLEAALAVNEVSGDRPRMIEALVAKAETHYDLGQFDETVHCAERAIELCAETGAVRERARALHVIGHAMITMGDRDAAEQRWVEAVELLGDAETVEGSVVLDHLAALRGPRHTIPDPRDPHLPLINSPTKEITERNRSRYA
ncbi:MAG: tetratricopeptide repeat protein [Saccharothrix sp.]|nr:tetratricopeptide repeat protein [Saccharothrix sp.]